MKIQPQTQSQNEPTDQSQDQVQKTSRTPFAVVGRLLERSQRRFRLSRPGSVLILCVALLVLLALIGTAMISTARIDRYASVQHTYNTQIDLLVEGVKAMAEGYINGDLYQTSTTGAVSTTIFRPADADTDTSLTHNYEKYDAIDILDSNASNLPAQNDAWLAPRVPQLQNITLPFNAITNQPAWTALTAPLAGQTVNNTTIYQYESPYRKLSTDPVITSVRSAGASNTAILPTSTLPTASGTIYPGMNIGGVIYMAADTDGDGIADAMYFKLPMGPIGGVTYYAACRIIDNNSAINANTAWCRDYDFTNIAGGFSRGTNPGAGMVNYGIFRSNVGLMEMFPDFVAGAGAAVAGTSNQMNTGSQSINGYRFGTPSGSANPFNASSDYTPRVYYRNSSGSILFRTDFGYTSQGDGLEFGLASRLENPGINFYTPDGSFTGNYRAFSWGDTAALAAPFAILNSSASPGELENDGSVGFLKRCAASGVSPPPSGSYQNLPSTPYAPADSATWFSQNFDFGNTTVYQRMPMRSLVVSRNPISNLGPVPIGPYDYNQDNVGTVTNGVGGNDAMIAPFLNAWQPIIPAPTVQPSGTQIEIGMSPYLLGTGRAVVNAKTNINTAPFEELWRAFWSVMSDVPNAAVTGLRKGASPPIYSVTADGGIFRSTWRDPRITGFTKLTQQHMLQIRSALSAVNAIDLRDGDDDITSREIPVYNMPQAGTTPTLAFRVRVYGNERQPFITKIYYNGYTQPLVQGDLTSASPLVNPTTANYNLTFFNPKGYVAVEIYNPYPTPMLLNRWAVGVVSKKDASSYTPAGAPALHIQRLTPRSTAMPLATFDEHYLNQVDPATGLTTKAQVIIPAQGYALLENYPCKQLKTAVGGFSTTDAQYRPARIIVNETKATGAAATIALVYVPNLSDVIADAAPINGGELMLLRPRRADGTLTSCDSTTDAIHGATNTYNEAFTDGTPNLADFVPIDAYDFTGLAQIGSAPNVPAPSWYYGRPNDTGTNAWKFVYPGLYDVTAGKTNITPRQEATIFEQPFENLQADHMPLLIVGAGGAGTYQQPQMLTTPTFPGIQLQNVNWGMNSTYDRWPVTNIANSPPGGFPAKPKTAVTYQYPFGGFARNGDIMMTPFIGAYQILPTTFADASATETQLNAAPFLEMTPITMDCSFADDCLRKATTGVAGQSSFSVRNTGSDQPSVADDLYEQLGRFCPINMTSAAGSPYVDDLDSQATYLSTSKAWRYHFATRLFDYLTVQGGSDDYLPLADPNAVDVVKVVFPSNMTWAPPEPTTPPQANDYPDVNGNLTVAAVKYPSQNTPVAVQNTVSTTPAADHRVLARTDVENRTSVDGLINVNTAPWYVLAQLPLLPQSKAGAVGADGIPANIEAVAKALANYRDSHPFKTLFDLNEFFNSALNPMQQISTPALPTDIAAGTDWDISSGGAQASGDFESRYLMLTRISNLVTTRSDSYTVYIVVDGFRGAGTNDPQLVVHRRAAMIVDRSAITPESGSSSNRINVSTQ